MQLSSTQETLQPWCSQSERSPVITGPCFRQVVLVKTADSGIKQYTRMLHVQNRSPNRPDPNIDPRVALIMRCIGILFQAARKVSRWHSSSSQRIAAHRSSSQLSGWEVPSARRVHQTNLLGQSYVRETITAPGILQHKLLYPSRRPQSVGGNTCWKNL